jgi:gentisate 1,2-dioxygenase
MPAAVKNFPNHFSFALDVALSKTFHRGYQTGILYHVCHCSALAFRHGWTWQWKHTELFRIAPNWVKFQIGLTNELLEGIVCCYSNAMSIFL